MISKKRLALAGLLAALVTEAGPFGQTPQTQQQPVFRSDAHFVQVDAYPIRDGKVVEGLTRADFEVREDGVLQTIDTFEFIPGGDAEPESARRDPNTVAESRAAVADPRARAFVVELDIDHVSIAGSHRIRVPLVQMLNGLVGSKDLFGVLTTEHDPTSITFGRKITTTEDMLSRYWSWGMRGSVIKDPEEMGYINCFEWEQTPRGPEKRMVQDEGRTRPLPDVIIELHREAKTLDHLKALVDYLGYLREGRTSVVLVTEGWRLAQRNPRLITEINRTQHGFPEGPASVSGQIQKAGGVVEGSRSACMAKALELAEIDGIQRLKEIIAHANQRNVSFIPVNPTGLVVYDDAPEGIMVRESGLRSLASNTDGTTVLGNNDLRAGLRRVTEELRSFYLLGYYSTNRKFDGRPRRIEVKARDYDVHARRGYVAPTEADRAARANPVKAKGPSAVEVALDVLSGLRSSDDRTFNVSKYLKADAAPVLGVPALFRATPSPRSPFVPVTAPAFTRNERIHVEWPVAQAVVSRSARILGRNSSPLAVAVTLTEREGPAGSLLVADATLGPLAAGDYVIELIVASAGEKRTSLVAFRVVP